MDGQLIFGIAGVGKMGEALVRGLIVGRVVPPTRILVSDAIPPRAREVAAKHGVAAAKSVEELAEHSDILVLAAKPKDMAALVKAIAGHVKKDALVVSLAAGVRTVFVETVLAGHGRVVRIMPNLACAVGEGASAVSRRPRVDLLPPGTNCRSKLIRLSTGGNRLTCASDHVSYL